MSKKLLTIVVCLLYALTSIHAQSIHLNGKVLNNKGESLPDIVIKLKGSNTGTVTNNKGEFSLTVSHLPVTLILSGIGYENQEYPVTRRKSDDKIVIVMKPVTIETEEVVVTAFAPTSDRLSETYTSSPRKTEVRIRGVATTTYPFAEKDRFVAKDKTTTSGLPTDIPRSSVLTAGELNDFKKWKLWTDYSQSEFRALSEHWNLSTLHRYCVQVQNQDHKAEVGVKVFLLNMDTRDTVWRAVTDNTGKAELWEGLDTTENNQDVYTIVCENQTIRFPTLFEHGINRISVSRPCSVPSLVDIAFVVDATGSMGDEIKYLQEELQDIISRTSEKFKETDLRLGAVFYRDHNDEYLTRHIDFQSDPAALLEFIKQQSARGGGDTPEAVEDALTTAMDSLHWHEDAKARLLFLVLDAPPHDEAREKMKSLIIKAAGKGIRIIPVVCSGADKSTEYLMRSIALATNGSYVFLTDDSGIGNPHIKPTTDEFKVELLNELIRRLIEEMIYMAPCEELQKIIPEDSTLVNNKIVVYPNPTSGRINIETDMKLSELFITDFTGKMLMKQEMKNKGKKAVVNLGIYPSGTYLIKYFTEEKGWATQKVVLIH